MNPQRLLRAAGGLAFLSAVFLFSGCASTDVVNAPARDGWRSLPLITKGKIDPNWMMTGYGQMVVDGDVIRTESDARGIGLFVYKKEKFGNCQLKVVFKPKDERANSGIYVRIADGVLGVAKTPGAPFDRDASGKISEASMAKAKETAEQEQGAWFGVHRGFEIQIAGGGDPWHRTGAVYSLAPSSADLKKPGQWQTMIVTLDGEKIRVELDGQQITTFDASAGNFATRKQWHEPKREPKRPQVGYIGLQTHDPGDVVWYKEVSVRSLK